MQNKNWIKSLYIIGVVILIADIFLGDRLKNRDILTILGFLILMITVIIQYSYNVKK